MKQGSVAVGYLDPGTWSATFGQSLVRLYLTDAFSSRRIIAEGGKELRNRCGSGGIVAGRNKVAQSFLTETNREWLFFVDSDMGFSGTIVNELLAAADPVERPIVGALCFALKRDFVDEVFAEKYTVIPTLYEFVETDVEVGFRSIPDYPRDTLVKVAGTGSAAILIHRSVFERIEARYGPIWYDTVRLPKGKDGPTTFSEDLSFCVRAAACDIPIHVHTGVKVAHDKGGVFLDEDAFDRQLTLASLQPVEVPA